MGKSNKPYEALKCIIIESQEDVLLASGEVISKENAWSDKEDPWEQA